MTKPALLLGLIGVSALALAACNPPHPRHGRDHDDNSSLRVISKLDCPDEQGSLTRRSAAADGRSCDYAGDDGAVVTLQLATLTNGDTGAILDPLGEKLRAELPVAPATPPTPPGATAAPKSGDHDKVDIDLPGVHIHADGDKATVNAGGWGHHGGVKVDADDHGAEVHVEDQGGGGIHKIMILTADSPGPNGYQVVGYEARGPLGGPIVVASVKAKDHEDHDDLLHDIRGLLSHNIGG